MKAMQSTSGFSLLELIIVLALSTLMLGGVFTILGTTLVLHRDFGDRLSAQQQARVALERIQRDLTLAGVGLTPMLPVFPKVVPREDGGIDLRHNSGGATTFLTSQPQGAKFNVNSLIGFAPGQTIAIYDATGAVALAKIHTLDERSNEITVDRDLGNRFEQANGTAVARIQEISYWVEENDGASTLRRKTDTDAVQTIDQNVVRLSITYYDDSVPPSPFDPQTSPDQVRIGVVEVELAVETWRERLVIGDRPSFTLRARVTPRALVIS